MNSEKNTSEPQNQSENQENPSVSIGIGAVSGGVAGATVGKALAGKAGAIAGAGAGAVVGGIVGEAIAIANTAASRQFYCDLLGMKLEQESENYGDQQEHLANVFGARVRISSLKAPEGLGIELLDYLTPTDGRPMPADTRSNDLWHWQTHAIVSDVMAAAQYLKQSSTFISSDVVELNQTLAFKKSFLIKDPDGHALRFSEK